MQLRNYPARGWVTLALAIALLLVLHLQLVGALLCGLGTYAVYRGLLRIEGDRVPAQFRGAVTVLLTLGVFGLIGWGLVYATHVFWTPHGGLAGLLQLLAETIDRVRTHLPPWVTSRLPDSTDDLQQAASSWLRTNAQNVQRWGQEALRVAAHLLLGFVIGLMAAFERWPEPQSEWGREAMRSLRNLVTAFTRIVSAQLRISLFNTMFTAIYLLIALPLAGVHLPLAQTMVVLTFFCGFIPIVGNLISNAAILLVSLTVAPGVALASLAFLMGIHKLEYFLNAHFVGRSTHVPASLILVSMLVLESAFGLAGLVAAPVCCAWLVRELQPATSCE